VHAGEILQFVTRARYRATPHRVTNRSFERTRVSIAFFLNPPLDTTVSTLTEAYERNEGQGEHEHIHRVLPPSDRSTSLHFGAAEWRRKGRNGWCYLCAPGDVP